MFVNFINSLICFFIKYLLLVDQSFVFSIDCLEACIQILGDLYFGRCFRRSRSGFFIILNCVSRNYSTFERVEEFKYLGTTLTIKMLFRKKLRAD